MLLSYTYIFSFLFLFTTVESILVHTTFGDLPTFFWWGINFLMLLFTVKLKPIYYNKFTNTKFPTVVYLLLYWNIFSILRGSFVADNYWEYKNLINYTFVLLIPILVYLFMSKDFISKIFSIWFKYMLFLVFLFIPFLTFSDFSGRYLAPVLLLLLLFPLLPYKWKVITIFFTLFVILTGLDARSNVIRFSIALIFGMMFYFKFLLIDKFFKLFQKVLMLLPILLLILAMTNIFNVFKMDQYLKGNFNTNTVFNGENKEENLISDTRTFIYLETISSAIKNNYVIFGRTPSQGYDSNYFGDHNKYDLGINNQRFSSEVAILNIFTWNGLVGVVAYFLVFFRSSFLAVHKSNNYYIKVIGLFVAFRWSYSFVEDFTLFDIQYIVIWILISMCLSENFRQMDDNEFKIWFLNLLDNSRLIKIRKNL